MNVIDISIKYSPEEKCPACDHCGIELFYDLKNVPVDGATVYQNRQSAIKSASGDLSLAFCNNCGFIFNRLFEDIAFPEAGSYQDQQGFSPAFKDYMENMADILIERYGLKHKRVLEIGCGKGDFLRLLVQKGSNRGFGVDPRAVQPDGGSDRDRIKFISEYYSTVHSRLEPDFIYCRHTLEHIKKPSDFINTIRQSIPADHSTPVFFELPDMTRILEEAAFWDIYYEHCGYYCPASLVALFERCGFSVAEQDRSYHDQHLILHAIPSNHYKFRTSAEKTGVASIRRNIVQCTKQLEEKVGFWNGFLANAYNAKKRVVIWGSGSKCVGFLSLLNGDQIDYVVDINPHRHDTYVPRFGKRIVPPQFLKNYKPDVVLVMNPVYVDEIANALNTMGLNPEIRSL